MNVPFSKEEILYQTVSSISGDIKVTQIGKERRLVVGGYVQSVNWDCPGVESRVWGRMASIALGACSELKNVLILGLGGGTVIPLLKRYKPEAGIIAIEVDSAIVDIARNYFNLSEVGGFEVLEKDAYSVITKKCRCTNLLLEYDLVIVDVYCGGDFDKRFWSAEFLSNLKGILGESGCVIFNRILGNSYEDISGAREFLLGFFSDVRFEKVNMVGREGNVLFLCNK